MKFSTLSISSGDIFMAKIHRGEALMPNYRKTNALELIADCKQYLLSKAISEELQERIEALKNQDKSITTLEAIEILLDYAEREMRACESLEKGKNGHLLNLITYLKRSFFK